jgi:NitT/TauT family transport system permease protein
LTELLEQQPARQSNSLLSPATGGRRQGLIAFIDIMVASGIFVALWQVVFQLKFYPSYLLPSPVMTFGRFLTLVNNGELQIALTATLERLIVGLVVSVVAGIAIGLVMANFKRFGHLMSSFSLGMQSFPSIAWVPFAILIVGLNNYGILFVVIISSIFSMMISTYNGVHNINPIYLKASKNMGVGRLTLLRSVLLPASMPSIITGIRQTWSFAWHALIGAEMLMASLGIGAILYYGAQFINMSQVVASMILIFAIGAIVDRVIFSRLETRIRVTRGLVVGNSAQF